MPIFNTEIPLTPEQKEGRRILALSDTTLDGIILSYKARWLDFWRNPTMTPIQVASGMDTQCLEFFQNAEIMRAALELIYPGALDGHSGVPDGWSAVPETANGLPTGRMIITQL